MMAFLTDNRLISAFSSISPLAGVGAMIRSVEEWEKPVRRLMPVKKRFYSFLVGQGIAMMKVKNEKKRKERTQWISICKRIALAYIAPNTKLEKTNLCVIYFPSNKFHPQDIYIMERTCCHICIFSFSSPTVEPLIVAFLVVTRSFSVLETNPFDRK